MRVFFLRDSNRFPIACVASEIITRDKDRKYVMFALSVCNPKDKQVFDRKRARSIAEGRMALLLKSTSRSKVERLSGFVPAQGNIKRAIMQTLELDHSLPQQVRNAAEFWLANRPVVEGEYLPPASEGINENQA